MIALCGLLIGLVSCEPPQVLTVHRGGREYFVTCGIVDAPLLSPSDFEIDEGGAGRLIEGVSADEAFAARLSRGTCSAKADVPGFEWYFSYYTELPNSREGELFDRIVGYKN